MKGFCYIKYYNNDCIGVKLVIRGKNPPMNFDKYEISRQDCFVFIFVRVLAPMYPALNCGGIQQGAAEHGSRVGRFLEAC